MLMLSLTVNENHLIFCFPKGVHREVLSYRFTPNATPKLRL